MSFIPNIVNRAYNVNVAVSRRLAAASTNTSIIVPVAEQTLDASELGVSSTILMDHPRLPPMQEFNLGYGLLPFMGHDFQGEFVYECTAQHNSGAFHLIGAPGLFSVGAVRWTTSHSLSDTDIGYSIQVTHFDKDFQGDYTQTVGKVKDLKGVEQAAFYLNTGDFFMLKLEPHMNQHRWGSGDYTLLGYSEVSLTRLSRNPDYTRAVYD